MMVSWDLDALNAELSAAALDPSRWKPALQHLSDTVGAVGTVLLPPPGRRSVVISTDALTGPNEQYIREGWNTRDQRDRCVPIALRRGLAVDLDFATEEQIARSDYYNAFLGRHGLRWCAIMAADAGDGPWGMSIQRSIAQGPFVPGEQARLTALRWPFHCAVTVSTELRRARAAGLAEAFDMLGSAAAVLDWRGEVILANRTAEKTLTAELRIVKRRLCALDHDLSKRIDRLVGRATSSWNGAALGPPLPIPRVGRRPLLVYAVPLVGEALDFFTTARALVIVVDLDARAVPAETHLRQALGLTSAEARVARQLAGGEALDTVAELLQIGKETARSQLKAVFAKTGTSRQAELVALLSKLVRSATTFR